MPQLDPSTFATQLFWLLLTLVPLYFVLRRAVLPRISEVLEARQRHIDSDLEKATKLREEAETVLAEYEKALAKARTEAAEAIKQTASEMAAESAKRHQAFGQELAAKTQDAENRVAKAKEAALAQVAAVAGEVAGAASAKLIGTALPADKIDEAVKDAMRGRG